MSAAFKLTICTSYVSKVEYGEPSIGVLNIIYNHSPMKINRGREKVDDKENDIFPPPMTYAATRVPKARYPAAMTAREGVPIR